MKNVRTLSTRYYFAALVIGLATGSPIFAQQPGPPPIDRSTNRARARQQDMSKREWQLRNPVGPPATPPDPRHMEALMAQIEEDFNRILLRHNKLVLINSSDQALDYRFVSEAAAEIRKRASRLQSTLALREPESQKRSNEESAEFNELQLKDALLTLCKSIKSFVTNPVIQTPGTVHVGHLETARRDLARVIKISSDISENAERLRRH